MVDPHFAQITGRHKLLDEIRVKLMQSPFKLEFRYNPEQGEKVRLHMQAIIKQNPGPMPVSEINNIIRRLIASKHFYFLDHPIMIEMDKVNTDTCPVAYSLAIHAGYNPAMIILLDKVGIETSIHHPFWPDKIEIKHGDTKDDVCAPVAPGMLWRLNPLTDKAEIAVNLKSTGLPEAILAQLPEKLSKQRLQFLVSHPVLNPINLGIEKVEVLTNEEWVIQINNEPSVTSLRNAILRANDMNNYL
jgi:hypothetical protein